MIAPVDNGRDRIRLTDRLVHHNLLCQVELGVIAADSPPGHCPNAPTTVTASEVPAYLISAYSQQKSRKLAHMFEIHRIRVSYPICRYESNDPIGPKR